ncbi:hypothetical protein ISTM_438 [Insectomime virus]|nr:hypothetical protein ISTM_438 [Insectomime virus]
MSKFPIYPFQEALLVRRKRRKQTREHFFVSLEFFENFVDSDKKLILPYLGIFVPFRKSDVFRKFAISDKKQMKKLEHVNLWFVYPCVRNIRQISKIRYIFSPHPHSNFIRIKFELLSDIANLWFNHPYVICSDIFRLFFCLISRTCGSIIHIFPH